jgi:ABC-2 type transport system permease protein
MSAVAETRTRAERSGGLSFGGMFRSEWIKFWSLRSSWWCLIIAVALTVGVGVLFGSSAGSVAQFQPEADPTGLLVDAGTAGIGFSMLVIAVLGALVVTGEYGSGMIRTTFLAAPTRYEPLGVKALLLGVVAFVVGAASSAVALLASYPMLRAADLDPDLGDGQVWLAVLGAGVSLALIAMMAAGLGTLLKSSALAITISVAVLFVLPIVFSILTAVIHADWFQHVPDYLPSSLASRAASYPADGGNGQLASWQAGLVLALWPAAMLGTGIAAARSRDA